MMLSGTVCAGWMTRARPNRENNEHHPFFEVTLENETYRTEFALGRRLGTNLTPQGLGHPRDMGPSLGFHNRMKSMPNFSPGSIMQGTSMQVLWIVKVTHHEGPKVLVSKLFR